ncbi:hypothetical protein IWX50DRAFT_449753 [Phyllosticta citricarpa]
MNDRKEKESRRQRSFVCRHRPPAPLSLCLCCADPAISSPRFTYFGCSGKVWRRGGARQRLTTDRFALAGRDSGSRFMWRVSRPEKVIFWNFSFFLFFLFFFSKLPFSSLLPLARRGACTATRLFSCFTHPTDSLGAVRAYSTRPKVPYTSTLRHPRPSRPLPTGRVR